MTLSLELPWPPAALSPNRRQHWARLAKAKKRYRNACFVETRAAVPLMTRADVALHVSGHRQAMCHFYGDAGADSPSLGLTLTFHPPTRRSYDRDNLLARMKAGLDGMCDALGIDDKAFATVTVSVGEVRPKVGGVVVRISAAKEGAIA